MQLRTRLKEVEILLKSLQNEIGGSSGNSGSSGGSGSAHFSLFERADAHLRPSADEQPTSLQQGNFMQFQSTFGTNSSSASVQPCISLRQPVKLHTAVSIGTHAAPKNLLLQIYMLQLLCESTAAHTVVMDAHTFHIVDLPPHQTWSPS